MHSMTELVQLVSEAAKEVDRSGDLIDFADLAIDESAAFEMMANHVVDGYYEVFDGNVAAMATVTALVVENFVLQLMLAKSNGVQDTESGV